MCISEILIDEGCFNLSYTTQCWPCRLSLDAPDEPARAPRGAPWADSANLARGIEVALAA